MESEIERTKAAIAILEAFTMERNELESREVGRQRLRDACLEISHEDFVNGSLTVLAHSFQVIADNTGIPLAGVVRLMLWTAKAALSEMENGK